MAARNLGKGRWADEEKERLRRHHSTAKGMLGNGRSDSPRE